MKKLGQAMMGVAGLCGLAFVPLTIVGIWQEDPQVGSNFIGTGIMLFVMACILGLVGAVIVEES